LWKCYEMKFKAKSPIHIGYGSKLGIINRTRYYIPGKTIWGAVTAILARKLMNNYDKELYGIVGDLVKENLIFSYFYPSREETVFYPNYTTEGFGFGSKENGKIVLTKEKFEEEFITSYISTALKKSSKTAEDSSLHEFELIKDKSNGKETIFTGCLFVKEGNIGDYSVNFSEDKPFIETKDQSFSLFDTIKNIQTGGERNYGFGWLELQDPKIKLDHVNLYSSDISVDLKDLSLNSNEFSALAHVEKNSNIKNIKGDLEPLVGREWNKRGAGQNINNAKICLTPGSKFKSMKIKIGHFGIWNN